MRHLAQRLDPLEEFFSEPGLTVACVLLIVVSVAWIVVTKLISRRLRKAERRGAMVSRKGNYTPPRDIWSEPPL